MDVFEYKGKGQRVPRDVVSVRFHPSVIEVEEAAFQDCRQLKEVVLNEGLKKIGRMAFKTCISLGRIICPSTVTEINGAAFYDCDSVKAVVLNEGLATIGNNAFRECTSLESINFPSTLITIGMESFKHCIKLRGVVLNQEIKKIGHLAFAHCKSLERINLKCTDTDTVLSGYVFAHCTRLRDLDLRCTQLYKHDKPMENKTFHGCLLERINFVTMSARLETIIQTGYTGVENKIDEVRGEVERNGHELFVSNSSEFESIQRSFGQIVALIVYYEVKEAATLFELALWKAKLDQAEDVVNSTERAAYRIEVPGPIKDTILQYLGSAKDDE